ncbi:SDR family oxidoreductase [Siphonobacter sp. SORGH_AS_1065]|uniref:SDR family oxidoreductase n=1 Tax=Siphonobacter sp. SORGH_AS_1065 TaxID=3041795 RepID=UPI00278ABD02|nr:SDR family oxidoreductase [Siphonobacter sp. SORGH_AS_1065]MDQ1086965.1 3-oxoacyl-[acyl-carrier protein] reductase [Siphonobacter sp. SORGH_AS_1065]
MDLDLTGKNALVGGSTQGLGWATAVELALLGANVTLIARNEKSLQSKVLLLPNSGEQTHTYLVADFSDYLQVESVVKSYLQTSSFHILINNTGGPAGGPLLNASPEDLQKAFSAHVICNQLLTQLLVPGMKQSGYGRIINIISTSVKSPLEGLGVSNTVRAAVANWSKTLANELGPYGITVNNVLPGSTDTGRLASIIKTKAQTTGKSEEEVRQQMADEIPARRIGTPEEFGAAAAFLCTPAASYINGINLPVDGGRLGCL